MTARRWLELASISSERIENRREDHPSTSTWSSSSTGLRPLPKLAMRWSMLVAMRPMSDVNTRIPTRVTTRETSRNPQPLSPENVPESNTRSSDCQNDSKKLADWPLSIPSPNPAMTAAATTRNTAVAAASHPMRTHGPRARLLSNR